MIREAFVLTSAADARCSVAGIPLLVRTILALQKAGIERCTLVGAAAVPDDARIRCAVTIVPALVPPSDDALRVIVGHGAVIDAALVRDLQARARPGEVLEVEDEGARVRVAPGPLVVANGGLRGRAAAGTLRPASASAAAVEHALLRGLENPRDGYLDRLVHRRLSRSLTRLLLRTPLSANAVTIIGITIGIVGGLLLGAPGPAAVIAGVLCLVASGVLDCSDGELARLRFAESRFGHALDVSGDTLVHAAVLSGIGLRLARAGELPGGTVLVLLALGILGAFAVITWSESTEARRHRVAAWENRVLDGVLGPLTTRDWHVFVVAFALAGRLDLLVPAAAVGAQAFWMVTLLLLLRVLRRTQGISATGPPDAHR